MTNEGRPSESRDERTQSESHDNERPRVLVISEEQSVFLTVTEGRWLDLLKRLKRTLKRETTKIHAAPTG